MSRTTLVSVLLVTWNTRDTTLRCLDCLPGGFEGPHGHEVIVVDNGSVDGTAEALALRDDVQLILNQENTGFAAAVNQAYAAAEGDLVLLLNSDVEVQPGSLSKLVDFLHEHREAAGAVPLYLNPDGTIQGRYCRLPTFTMLLANASTVLRRLPIFRRRIRSYRMLDDVLTVQQPVEQPSASCLLLRRSTLPADALLDERFPIFFNDVQLARWFQQQGQKLWLVPTAYVTHDLGTSTRRLGRSLRRQHLASLVRFVSEIHTPKHVAFFRGVLLCESVMRWMLRPRDALSLGELRRALAGDPGELPTTPTEDAPKRRRVS